MMTALKFVAFSLSLAACLPPAPYLTLKGPTSTNYAVESFEVTARGVAIALARSCTRKLEDHWCTRAEPNCRPSPIETRSESVECAAAGELVLSVKAPWGQVYKGSGTTRIEVPLDWGSVAVDAFAPDASSQVRKPWLISADDGAVATSYALSSSEGAAVLAVIGDTGSISDEPGDALTPTTLSAVFASSSTRNEVVVAVTNTGHSLARRVTAKLRSTFSALHNVQLSFGRIAPGTTKQRAYRVAVPFAPADASPIAVAEVTATNAPALSIHRRLSLEGPPIAPPALKVTCAAPPQAVVPGQSARVSCEIVNRGETSATELVYTVAALGASTAGIGPQRLAPNEKAQTVFSVAVPPDATPALRFDVVIAVQTGTHVWRSAPAVITVQTPSLCEYGKLSQRAFDARIANLRKTKAAGSITSDEYDQYEAALVLCKE